MSTDQSDFPSGGGGANAVSIGEEIPFTNFAAYYGFDTNFQDNSVNDTFNDWTFSNITTLAKNFFIASSNAAMIHVADIADLSTFGGNYSYNSTKGAAVRFKMVFRDLTGPTQRFAVGCSSAAGSNPIDSKVNSAIETNGLFIGIEGTTDGTALRVYSSDGVVGTIDTVATVPGAPGQLYDVIIVFDAVAGESRYYLDGTLVATHTTVPTGGSFNWFYAGGGGATQGWVTSPVYNLEL